MNTAHVGTKPESMEFSQERLKRIDALLQGYIARGELSGVIAKIAHRGESVYDRKFGWMNIEAKQPMQEDAIFMIASMTKPITAVAAMMLYEEGHFNLNTPISKFIPAFADTPVYAGSGPQGGIYLDDRQGDITFRHLFTHTAGLSYGLDANDPVDRLYQQAQAKLSDQPLTNQLVAKDLSQLPLAFQPGTHWRYSLGIDVLGALVEIIAGIPFEQFLQERIFDPLGMFDTGFSDLDFGCLRLNESGLPLFTNSAIRPWGCSRYRMWCLLPRCPVLHRAAAVYGPLRVIMRASPKC